MKKLSEYIIKSGIILNENDYNYIFSINEKNTDKEERGKQLNFDSLKEDRPIFLDNSSKIVQSGTELITLNLIAINSYIQKMTHISII